MTTFFRPPQEPTAQLHSGPSIRQRNCGPSGGSTAVIRTNSTRRSLVDSATESAHSSPKIRSVVAPSLFATSGLTSLHIPRNGSKLFLMMVGRPGKLIGLWSSAGPFQHSPDRAASLLKLVKFQQRNVKSHRNFPN